MWQSKTRTCAILVGAALALTVYGSSRAVASTPECKVDADCVPRDCCHATECIPEGKAPDCTAVACTAECRPRTLDCGGRCVCTSDGLCVAKLKDEPSP